jgi:hypothetical protein
MQVKGSLLKSFSLYNMCFDTPNIAVGLSLSSESDTSIVHAILPALDADV